ncbi:homoserine kinase [Euzebya tangerina]|uniref:homoserine kinase n=1 Tax=Euzebya tangerina TaxID=591198 RepID=UPI0013C2DC1A|nr:homoserine kinase [Euzebya tangerina]
MTDRGPAVELEGDEVGVAVPATSANLGAGFDSVAVALDIPLIAVVTAQQERRIIAEGEGADDLPSGDDNLVWQAFGAWCDQVGHEPPEVSITVRSQIPLQRGMGSSAAAAVAGVMLAAAVTSTAVTRRQIIDLVSGMEGHRDNAAAAVLGGLVVCTDDGEVARVTPSPALRPIIIIPSDRVPTSEARAILPTQVPLDLAAANAASITSTVLGLAGQGPLRASSMVDRLHEPTRLDVMPTSRALIEGLRAAGVPAVLSGAGPAVLAVVQAGEEATGRVRDVVGDVTSDSASRVVPTSWDLAGAERCPPA